MFDDIGDIRKTRKQYNFKMFDSDISAFRAFEELEAAALKDGAVSQKNKELIALGISIAGKCLPCVEYHISAAMEHGAEREEILETVALAMVLGGGISQWPSRFAFKVLEDLQAERVHDMEVKARCSLK